MSNDVPLALGHLAITGLAAWTIGHWILRGRLSFPHAAFQIAAESATGLFLISYLIFTLAAFRLVSKMVLAQLCLSLFVIAVLGLLKNLSLHIRFDRQTFTMILLGLLYGTWMILCASLPATDRDELIYHLEVPKQFLHSGGLVPFQDNIYGYFPQLGEMLFLYGWANGGEAVAKLIHVLSGFLLSLALYGFSRLYLSRHWSCLSVALFLTIPSVVGAMPLAYVDLIFSLYAFLAFVSLSQFFKTRDLKWILFSGLAAGAASATKYNGIQFVILLVCLTLVEHIWKRRKGIPLASGILIFGSLIVASPYFIRNWVFTGWPLFPFNIGNLSLAPGLNWDTERARLFLGWLSTFGTPLGKEALWHSFLAPALVFIRAEFHEPEFYEGIIGPIFLLTPFLLFFIPKEKCREINPYLLFSILFLYYWAFTTKQIRFLIPILPILSFLFVYGFANTTNCFARRFAYALVVLSIPGGFILGAKQVWAKDPLHFWLGQESPEAYRARQWKGYAISQEANRRLGHSDQLYLIHMKNYLYYLNCRVRTDFIFERYQLDRALEQKPAVEDLAHFFRSQAVTHLLMDEEMITSPQWGLKSDELNRLKEFLEKYGVLIVRDQNQSLYQLTEPFSAHPIPLPVGERGG